MQSRDCHDVAPQRTDLVLRTPPNWTAVAFLGMLGALHLCNAIPSLLAGRGAGYLSLAVGALTLAGTVAVYFCRSETAFIAAARVIRLRTGVGRFSACRWVRFGDVRAVRLTAQSGLRDDEMLVELLCRREDILCPPTKIPRQEALFLAMLIDVPLIKVADAELPPIAVPELADEPQLLDALPTRLS